MVAAEVTPKSVRLLRSARVDVLTLPSRGDAPLTEDELIAFGRSIEGGDDPWSELLATV